MPTAVITGASKGIGRAIALRLAPSYDIVALARSGCALRSLGAEIAPRQGDAPPSVSTFKRDPAALPPPSTGCVDVLVNNAAVLHKKAFIDLAPTEWSEMMDVSGCTPSATPRTPSSGDDRQGAGHGPSSRPS
ncbi:MAG: SDR family NAD(P)-dependent oxidoreductase [Gemmatimonadetes bacterium]|nr:SDR family NAD(P)-dependent oxidoreductase [Gemmatimonadota bacterium]